jgi:sulfide:quinone oxidoreductase
MRPQRITDRLFVSTQISPAEVAEAARHSFKSIINNRPDGEAADQPRSADIEAAAGALGLGYRHIPVVPGQIGEEDVERFAAALSELGGPVLAFCRTGTRSVSLWALSAAATMPPGDVVGTAREAGYDLLALAPRLDAIHHSAGGQPS